MDMVQEFRKSIENPESSLAKIRMSIQPDQTLIDDYINAETLLEQEQRNPLPQEIFDDTKDATVLNLADGGHMDDAHFLSLLHPDTVDKAKASGFKDIVLEGGDIDMTSMFDEYTRALSDFAAGQEHVEITLGDEIRRFTEPEYKAHMFGTIRNLSLMHHDYEEASRTTRATMDTLEYAASQDIRIHSIGTSMEQTGNFVLTWQDNYDQAKSLPANERSPYQINLIESFDKKGPVMIFMDVAMAGPSTMESLNPTARSFAEEAYETFIDERIGGATVNRVTADKIEEMIQNRQEEGYTNPRVLHMHGLLHFSGTNDIDDLLTQKNISSQTIGFSGASDRLAALSGAFNAATEHSSDSMQKIAFPQKWFFAPAGEYIDVNVEEALSVIEPKTSQNDIGVIQGEADSVVVAKQPPI